MKLVETGPEENRRLYAGVVLLILLSFYAFLFRPANAQLTTARDHYHALTREIVTGRQRARDLYGYAERVRLLKGQVLVLEQRLRAGNQVLLFFKDAEWIAGHSGVQLEAIKPTDPRVENEVTKQQVEVDVAGPLPQVLHFVNHLENLAYPVHVVKFDVGLAEASQNTEGAVTTVSGGLQAKVLVELYSLVPPPAKPGAPPQAAGSAPAAQGKAGEGK